MNDRKYLPTLSELIDRLSIAQLKEVFIKDHKKEYAQEIKDIVNDIQLTLDEKSDSLDADTIRAIIVLSQMNLHIWHNESNYRNNRANTEAYDEEYTDVTNHTANKTNDYTSNI